MSLVTTKQLINVHTAITGMAATVGNPNVDLNTDTPQAKPENVHKEHAVAEFRHFGNDARRLRNADTAEQQKLCLPSTPRY